MQKISIKIQPEILLCGFLCFNVGLCMFVCMIRMVELNSRFVCGLSVGKFNDLVMSSTDETCRVVVLRETVEYSHQSSSSLSHDIS